MGQSMGQWRRHSESLEERSVEAGSGDYSYLYPGEDGKSKHGEIMVACLTTFGHAAEPKEVGRREEEITFGIRIGVSPQSSIAKRALRDASCQKVFG